MLRNRCVKMVSARDISGIDLEGNSNFWEMHGRTEADYYNLASKIPQIEAKLENGASIEEITSDEELKDCYSQYYSDNHLIKVQQEENGEYTLNSDGRHRVIAAQEFGYEIPVEVTNVDQSIDERYHLNESDEENTEEVQSDSTEGRGQDDYYLEDTELGSADNNEELQSETITGNDQSCDEVVDPTGTEKDIEAEDGYSYTPDSEKQQSVAKELEPQDQTSMDNGAENVENSSDETQQKDAQELVCDTFEDQNKNRGLETETETLEHSSSEEVNNVHQDARELMGEPSNEYNENLGTEGRDIQASEGADEKTEYGQLDVPHGTGTDEIMAEDNEISVDIPHGENNNAENLMDNSLNTSSDNSQDNNAVAGNEENNKEEQEQEQYQYQF